MFDSTTLLWTGIGAASLVYAFLDYTLSYKKMTKAETRSEEQN